MTQAHDIVIEAIPVGVNVTKGPPLVTAEQLNGSYDHPNTFYNQDFGDSYRVHEEPMRTPRKLRIITVGAGMAGIMLAKKIEVNLKDVEHQVYEKYPDVGGTWLENRYPGCRCDIPSHIYQYSWAPNPNWSSYYSTAPEIWQYFKDVAVQHDLEKYIKFNHRIVGAKWNEKRAKWDLDIQKTSPEDGSVITFKDECDILINSTGLFSNWKWPKVPGIEKYKGKKLHSARWDDSYDFKDKNIAVIGCGSSAIQIVPQLQPLVASLKTYIRSSTWITAGFGIAHTDSEGQNFEYSNEQKNKLRKDPELYNRYRFDIERELNMRFRASHIESEEQKDSQVQMKELMLRRLGNDERIAKKMIPNFPVGCRRPTPGNGYLETLIASNVEVITESVEAFTETGLLDSSGREVKYDAIVCATGFDVNFKPMYPLIGKDGADLRDAWADKPVGK